MKKIPILSNIFSRSRSGVAADVVETDAVPIDDPPGREISSSENISNNLSVNSSDLNAALQLQAQMDESRDLSVVRSSSNNEVVESSTGNVNSITNNQMAVHNTQGQVVMQFSHINGLHFGSVYNINSEKLEQSNTESVPNVSAGTTRSRPRRTTTIEAMMRSSEELNHRMLDTISTHLGEGWKKVLRDLGLTNGQIEQSIIDNQIHGGIREVIYQLLLGWTQNAEDGTATLGIITQHLWKLDHRECVYQMRDVWKRERAARDS